MNSPPRQSALLPNGWPWLAGLLLFGVLLYLLSPIMMPFVIGAGLSYIGDPLVDRLQKIGLSRTLGVCVVFVVIAGLSLIGLLLFVPMLQRQLVQMLQNLPETLRWIQDTALPHLGITLPPDLQLDANGLRDIVREHWREAGDLVQQLWGRISQSSGALIAFAVNLLMVPIVTFYLLRDWDDLVAWIADIIPRRWLPTATQLARDTDNVLGAFLRGQLLVMLALSVTYTLGLWAVGLDLALLVGTIAGLVSFVPYLGAATGILLGLAMMFVQTQAPLPLLWVALVFGVGQMLESMVYTPLLVGDRIGLHPVAVIFAVMAGGQLFGFIGILLALPVAAAVAVVLRHSKQRWLASSWYHGGTDGDPMPEAPDDDAPRRDTDSAAP